MPSEVLAAYVGAGVNAVGLAFVAIQVVLARRQLQHAQDTNNAEIRRVRRQATIEYFMSTVEQRERLAAGMPDSHDTDEINQYIDAAFSEEGGAKQRRLRDYFSFYEAMAVAVAADVYDLVVLDAMDGGTIRSITTNYRAYFQRVRGTPQSSTWFVELEWLVSRNPSGFTSRCCRRAS
jgi:hypothetical protein